MKNQQSGFTLIELVMVIVILGILAAFALPKFADLSGDAERATAMGGLAAVKSAAGISHAAYLAGGSADPTIEGTTYIMVFGYPSSEDIDELAGLDSAYSVADTSAILATVTIGGCTFTYTEAADASTPPVYGAVVCT
ncbi:MAG: type II secretory pathway pseudopilin PulG [Gammaproteobacteria bacterium]|nr:MAG: type II secretory pathway pseudopilin PulG [Gammaproteobacteria bacterium]